MGKFKDAIDKQSPPNTDQERAEYYARRAAFLATPEPLSHVLLRAAAIGLAFIAIPVVFSVTSAHAAPVVVPVMSSAAVVAGRNSQECEQTKSIHCANWSVAGGIWDDGPCKGRTHFECTPVPVRKDR